MLSKFIMPGDKVEMTAVGRRHLDGDEGKKVYTSKVSDVLSDEQLEIVMPMEKTKLILLPVDGEFEICFYAKAGIFLCKAKVVDRYKAAGIYILLFELTGNLRKNQRREYYRFNCIISMRSRELSQEEIKSLDSEKPAIDSELPMQGGVMVDLSGGGIRFVSNYCYEKGAIIQLQYSLVIAGAEKTYELPGKVLMVRELENRKGQYEHRVQYVRIQNSEREEIIRYIFEEERKNRQKR